MANISSSSSNSGVGFFGLLTVAFIILKLTGYINWSWWFVLGPLWMPIVFITIVLLFVCCLAAIKAK